jgi:hypothetical protein
MPIEPSPIQGVTGFGAYRPTVSPKWDSLCPYGFDVNKYELNYRVEETRHSDADDTRQSILTIATIVFGLRVFVVWLLSIPSINAWLNQPKGYPWVAFIGIVAACICIYARPHRWTQVFGAVLMAPGVSVFLTIIGGVAGPNGVYWQVLMVVPTFCAAGYLVDQILTHAVFWLSADHKLTAESMKRRRAWWRCRLESEKLNQAISELEALKASNADDAVLAEAISYQLKEAKLLANYKTGLAVLALYAALVFLPWNLWLLLVVPPAAVLLMKFSDEDSDVLAAIQSSWNAVVCWYSYGRYGVRAPGVFQSPCGGLPTRVHVTFWVLMFMAIQLVPTLPVLIEGDARENAWGWLILIRLLGAVAITFFALFVSLVCVGGPLLASLEKAVASDGVEAKFTEGQSAWDVLQSRLRASSFEEEAQSLWFGIHAVAGYPVILPSSTTREHLHEVGATGSGKTSRGLAPLITQLIRVPKGHADDAAMIILDFKGDRALFENARIEAERKGVAFRYVTNILGHSSAVFNPVAQLMAGDFSPAQAAQIIMAALGLEHGPGYGRSYFSRMGREWLVEILTRFPWVRSFSDIAKFTEGNTYFRSTVQKRECGELVAAVRLLAGYPELNATKPGTPMAEAEIDMARVIERREVVYFYLPAGLSLGTIREIGSMALYTAYAAAVSRKNKNLELRRCHLIIDEFQIVANKTFEMVIEQARGLGLDLVLSHQSLFDLKTPDAGYLLNVVQSNTRVRRYSSIDDPVVQELISKSSGDTVYVDAFFGEEWGDPEIGIRPYVAPRMSRNDIITFSAEPSLALLHITRDGTTGPKYGGLMFPIRVDFHISADEFERRDRAPWPPLSPGLVEVGAGLGAATSSALSAAPKSPPWVEVEDSVVESMLVDSEVEPVAKATPAASESSWSVRLNREFKRQFEK